MKITKITPQKYRNEYITISFEDGQTLKSHQAIERAHKLEVNQEVSLQLLEELRGEEELREAMEYATLSLSLKDRSVDELTQKLRGRKFSMPTIHIVLDQLKTRNLMSDAAFAKNYVESKLETRSSEKVKEELTQKGVQEEIIEEALKNVEEENKEIPSEEERAFQLLLKRAQQIRAPDSRTLYRRLYDFLSRRGFEQEIIEGAFRRYKKIGGSDEPTE